MSLRNEIIILCFPLLPDDVASGKPATLHYATDSDVLMQYTVWKGHVCQDGLN